MVFDAVDDIGDDDLGFDEVVVDAEAFGAGFVAFLAEGGEHNNLGVGGFWGVAQNIKDVTTTDFGHHDIEEYEVGVVAEDGG